MIIKYLGANPTRVKNRNDGEKIEDYIKNPDIEFTDSNKVKYPISLEKILRMYQSLFSNGFTSYAEA